MLFLSTVLSLCPASLGTPVQKAQAAAGINRTIHYQGKVSLAAGSPVTNGSYNMRFRIYAASSGGAQLWSETWDSTTTRVTMTGGLFSVALGTHVTMTGSVDFNSDSLYLQIEFDPGNDGNFEEVFSPRRRFSSVPYAHNADRLTGLMASQFLRADQSGTASGKITIKNAGVGLNVTGIASGKILQAQNTLASSGNLVVRGTSTFQSSIAVRGALSGASLTVMHGTSYMMGMVGIGTALPKTKLEVLGTISGSLLTVTTLKSCSALETTASGAVICGVDDEGLSSTFGTGNVLSFGNKNWVKKSGDTMTGGLLIVSTAHSSESIDVGLLLEIGGTASGRILHAHDELRGSGSLNVSTAKNMDMATIYSRNDAFSNTLLTLKTDNEDVAGNGPFDFLNLIDDANGTPGTVLRILSSGEILGGTSGMPVMLTSENSVNVNLDYDNNGTGNYFAVRKDGSHINGEVGFIVKDMGNNINVGINTGTAPGAQLAVSGAVIIGNNITTQAAKTALEVIGTISGSLLTVTGLKSCSSLQTSASGAFACGSAGAFDQSAADARYVKRQGSTMTGGLLIMSGGAGTQTIDADSLLEIVGTASGKTLHAQDALTSSGKIVLENAANGGAVSMRSGTGDPNGSVTGTLGSLFFATDTGKIWKNNNGSTQWAEIATGSGTVHMAKMRRASSQTISANIFQKIYFDTEDFDVGNIANVTPGTTGSGRITIARAGKYLVQASWFGNGLTAGAYIDAYIYKNGSSVRLGRAATTTNDSALASVTDVLDLAVGDVIEIRTFLSAGSEATSTTAGLEPQMSITQVDGIAGAGGGGSLDTAAADSRYVKRQGSTMTGGLLIMSGGAGTQTIDADLLLEIVGTASGKTLHAQDALTSSGKIVLENAANGGAISMRSGTGDPNGSVTGTLGSLFFATDTGKIWKNNNGSTQWAEVITGSGTVHMAKMTRDSAQSILSSMNQKIYFDTEEHDVGGIANVTPGTSGSGRITITRAGKYLVTGYVGFVTSIDLGERVIAYLFKNGAPNALGESQGTTTDTGVVNGQFTTTIDLAVGDYLEMYVFQGEGATQSTSTTSYIKPRLSVTQLDGIAGAGGGGSLDTAAADSRYVKRQGSTMTGGLLIMSGGAGTQTIDADLLLEVVGTMSGRTLHAQDALTSSGKIVLENSANGGAISMRSGTGDPNGSLTGTLGSLFFATDTGKIWKNNNGSTQWGEIMTGSGTLHTARLARTSNQTVLSGMLQKIYLNIETYDTGNIGNIAVGSTGSGRITIRKAGKYLVTGHVQVATLDTGEYMYAYLLKNGAAAVSNINISGGSTFTMTQEVTETFDLVAGDYIELATYHVNGASSSVVGQLSIAQIDGAASGSPWTDDGSVSYLTDTTDSVAIGAVTVDTNVKLEVIGTMSGRVLHAQDVLRSSGSLVVQTTGLFKGNLTTRGTLSGNALTVMNGTSYFLGNVGIGKTNPSTKLDVRGTISGSLLTISGLKSCSSLQTSASGAFACGSGGSFDQAVADARYVKRQGSTMTGGLLIMNGGAGTQTIHSDLLLEIVGTASGRTLHAQDALTSSGKIVLENAANGGAVSMRSGTGDPNGTVTGTLGSLFFATDTGKIWKNNNGSTQWGEIVTGSGTVHMAKMSRNTSGGQSIFTNVWSKIYFDVEDFDVGGIANVSNSHTGSGRVTIKRAGKYLLSASLGMPGLDSGESLAIGISKNGATPGNFEKIVGFYSAAADQEVRAEISEVLDLAVGDYVEIFIFQNEGSSWNTLLTSYNVPRFSVVQLDGIAGAMGDLMMSLADTRYVRVQGDTMTGGLLIINGGAGSQTVDAGLLLEVVGTASGRILHAQDMLRSSGSLIVRGTARFQSGAYIGGHLIPLTTNAYDLGTNTNRFRDLYLSGSSLHIGNSTQEGKIGYRSSGFEGLTFYGSGGAVNPAMFISSGGLVGIGTSTPAAPLHIVTAGSRRAQFVAQNPSGSADQLISFAGNDTQWNIGQDESDSGKLKFSTDTSGDVGASTLMTMTSTQVGIGTSPGAELHVMTTDASAADFLLDSATDAASNMYFREGTTLKWVFNSNHSNDRLALLDGDVSHGVYIDQNTTSWAAASDKRLKEHVEGLSVLDKIDNFRAVGFDWKSTGTHDIGVIAQELYELFPEVVIKGSDSGSVLSMSDPNAWGVMYDKLGVLALQGVKELNQKLDALGAGGSGITVALPTAQTSQTALQILTNVGGTGNTVLRADASGNVYSDGTFTGGGADYAEWFLSSAKRMQYGEAVCVDTARPNTVTRCTRSGDANIIGVVSSEKQAAFIGNKFAGAEGLPVPNTVLVGLVGQLSANMIVESGASIRAGDALAAASVPGFLRKAEAGEASVGIALEEILSGKGMRKILISPRNRSLTAETVSQRVEQSIAAMNIGDEVQEKVRDAVANLGTDGTLLRQVEDQIETLGIDDRLAALEKKIGTGAVIDTNEKPETNNQKPIDSLSLSGSLRAVDILASTLSIDSTLTVGSDARIAGDLYVEGTLNLSSLFIPGIVTIDGALWSNTLEIASGATIKGPLNIYHSIQMHSGSTLVFATGATLDAGSLIVREALHVLGPVTIEGLASFLGDVNVYGTLAVSSRQAGFVSVPKTGSSVTVTFEHPFATLPVVNVTPNGRVGAEWWVDDVTASGFTIRTGWYLKDAVQFSWFAVGIVETSATGGLLMDTLPPRTEVSEPESLPWSDTGSDDVTVPEDMQLSSASSSSDAASSEAAAVSSSATSSESASSESASSESSSSESASSEDPPDADAAGIPDEELSPVEPLAEPAAEESAPVQPDTPPPFESTP